MGSRRTLRPVAAALVAVMAAGCGDGVEPGEVDTGRVIEVETGAADGAGRETAVPEDLREVGGFDEARAAAERMEIWALLLTTGIDEFKDVPGDPHTKSAALLAKLDFLLRTHTVMSAFATDFILGGEQRAFLAAADSVGNNTEELRREIFRLFDEGAAEEFNERWEEHVSALFSYARALEAGEGEAADRALAELRAAMVALAELFSDLTGRLIETDEILEALLAHVETITAVVQAQQEGEAAWYSEMVPATDAMAAVAAVLAEGLARQLTLAGDVTSPAAQLRAEFSGRFVESAYFTAFMTRAKLVAPPEEIFRAARELAAVNTSELTATMREVFGPEVARRFADLWSTQRDLYVEMTEAIASTDEDAREAIREELAEFAKELAALLEDATNGALGADLVERQMSEHIATVVETIEEQAEFVGA